MDTAINDIVNIAERAYDKWVEESKVAPQPKTDHERDMADLYQFLKTRYKNMKDSSLTFTRISGSELSISNIENGDNYLVMYDSITGDIVVNTNRGYSPRYKRFKLDDPKRFEKVASVVFGFASDSEDED